ncbi:MAG: DUF1080 domain-containing protein [Saprospirales bacterium]|nr:DUF1080 domain-containing protein [Saprospirales bacterium]MBK8923438.1 DUF1080 domain-containing protein [Saprospirales bacterium]
MRLFFTCLLAAGPVWGHAQDTLFPMTEIPLVDLSAFRPAQANWQIAGDAAADFSKPEDMRALPGAGVLINLPDAQHRSNLVWGFEHGDIDLDLEVMMAAHSNSGIYLQGRYEVQLLDSWGKQHPAFSDIGGVYERWDDNKPEGQKGFQGIPPRMNAARAPGLWQRLRIEFQAPRFDDSGKKTANARLIRVVLNGVTVQENVELTGPTRGAAFPGESRSGPVLIQGDHGPVAFRHLRYRTFGGTPPQLQALKYRYFSGEHDYLPHFPSLKPDITGNADGLTWEYAKGDNDFALQFFGTLVVPESGAFRFTLSSNANSMLKIAGDTVIGQAWWTRTGAKSLPAGPVDVEITYCKAAEWLQPALGLYIEGNAFRPAPLHLPSSHALANPVAPILVQVGNEPELMRSFIDIPQASGKPKRLVHPISVGYPEGLSYTYNLENGALVQVWKGGFLDATPMWHDRGDGHAEPLGSVLLLGDTPPLAPFTGAWPDSLGPDAAFRLHGYRLDARGNPAFQYTVYGIQVEDRISPQENGKGLSREIHIAGTPTPDLAFRIAAGQRIEQVAENTWAVDDKRYYVRLFAKPEIRTTASGQELILLATESIQYHLIW